MKKYKVVWQIQLEKEVEAESIEDAQNIIENIDCQHDGSYKEDSFEFVKTEEL